MIKPRVNKPIKPILVFADLETHGAVEAKGKSLAERLCSVAVFNFTKKTNKMTKRSVGDDNGLIKPKGSEPNKGVSDVINA